MAVRSFGNGRFHTGEDDLVIKSSTYKAGGPLVVVCDGAGNTPYTYERPAGRDLDVLADSGCLVVVTALGGLSTWGVDTVVHPTTGRIAEIRTVAAAAPWNADVSRMALIGDSMGGMDALGYHWRAPANVKCTALRIPVVAADALHDRDPVGLGALIDTAYGGGAAWDADKANRDPSATTPAGLIAAFASKVRIWYSTNDPTVIPADVTGFVAATGVRAIPLGDVGHTYAGHHGLAQAEWIWSKLNA